MTAAPATVEHPEKKGQIMAKDKSTKSEKTTKAKGGDDFAKPSEAPAGGEGWALASDDNEGDLFLITPLRVDHVADKFSKEPGAMKEVIVADVVHLDEKKPAKSEEHTDVWIFQGYLKGALRGYIGERKVLGRLVKGETKDRGNYPWMLEDADADDITVARAYLDSVDPFAQKGASKPAEKAGKKKGK